MYVLTINLVFFLTRIPLFLFMLYLTMQLSSVRLMPFAPAISLYMFPKNS